MALEDDFKAASQAVLRLPEKPSTGDLLSLYALYKQATEGDVSGKRPGMLDIKGRKKFDAWAEQKGATSQAAMEKYIALVNRLQG